MEKRKTSVVEELQKEDIEKLKARMILGQMGGPPMGGGMGQNVAASPMATPPFGAQMKQAPMQGKPQGVGGPAMPPMPAPAPPTPGGPAAPGGLMNPNLHKPVPQAPPMAQPGVNPAERPETKREREVRKSLENLRGVVMEMAATVYQMPLTEEQVRDLAFKLLEIVADRISDITVDRVREIGHDLVGEILVKRKYD